MFGTCGLRFLLSWGVAASTQVLSTVPPRSSTASYSRPSACVRAVSFLAVALFLPLASRHERKKKETGKRERNFLELQRHETATKWTGPPIEWGGYVYVFSRSPGGGADQKKREEKKKERNKKRGRTRSCARPVIETAWLLSTPRHRLRAALPMLLLSCCLDTHIHTRTRLSADAGAHAHALRPQFCSFFPPRQIMSLEQLAVAKDRKDKLVSRVLKKRIELDFRDRSPHSDNAIHCCHHCAGLFSEKVGLRHARKSGWLCGRFVCPCSCPAVR